MTDLSVMKDEINAQLSDKETFNSLVKTTFSNIPVQLIKAAVLEGRMRGFTFEDFLKKHVYAIGYGEKYNLVTSIDYARKIGARSGVSGTSAPIYAEVNGDFETCSVTVFKKDGHPNGYTATVYFDEYDTGKSLWKTKPKTMIAKVAEMHALRMACPEEMSQMYVSEEVERGDTSPITVVDLNPYKQQLAGTKNMNDLKSVWAKLPAEAKKELQAYKEELKNKYENT